MSPTASSAAAMQTTSSPKDLSDRKVIVVTGAGASRRLGAMGDLPLMGDWAEFLRVELDKAVPGLARAMGLAQGVTGPQFEEILGLFLEWGQAFQLNARFATVGLPGFAEAHPRGNEVKGWMSANQQNHARFIEELWASLYRHFKAVVIDREKAQKAYAKLDEALAGARVPKKVATTNYEQSAEIAFDAINYTIKDGFQNVSFRTPTFDPTGLGDWSGTLASISVLHLHGAVGWYRREDNTVLRQAPDQEYNGTLGVPVILPPDPKKNPLNDATVAGLWAEFRSALASATHVLVLGHSLHDPALVRQLRDATARGVQVLVAGIKASNEGLPDAATVELDFGPEMQIPQWGQAWLETGNSAIQLPPGTRATITASQARSRSR